MKDANRLAALATMLEDGLQDRCAPLSPRAGALLISLEQRGALTVSVLAAVLGVRQPTASRLIDGLERQGLVARRARDGRERAVALTGSGRRRAAGLREARAGIAERALGALSPAERQTFAALLDRMLSTLTRDRAHARTTCRYCDHAACLPEGCPVDESAGQREAGQGGA